MNRKESKKKTESPMRREREKIEFECARKIKKKPNEMNGLKRKQRRLSSGSQRARLNQRDLGNANKGP